MVNIPARRLGRAARSRCGDRATHPPAGLAAEVVVDVVDERAVAVARSARRQGHGTVVSMARRTATVAHTPSQTTHCWCSSSPGTGVALVVDARGEAGVAAGATPAVDARALEELSAHLEEVVGRGPAHRAQARRTCGAEAPELHGVAGHVALVIAASVVESLPPRGWAPSFYPKYSGMRHQILGAPCTQAVIFSARSGHSGSVVASAPQPCRPRS